MCFGRFRSPRSAAERTGAHPRVGGNADGRNIQLAPSSPFVERLDVLQDVLEAKAVRRDALFRQAEEHEGVVRVR